MSEVAITIDTASLRRLLARAPEATSQRIRTLLEGAGITTQGIMRIKAPVGATGDLRRTVRYFFRQADTVAVEPAAGYAEPVEKGTRPHWTSAKEGTPLWRWARQKGIPVYAVQRSIAMKGTKPHPFMDATAMQAEPIIKRDFDAGISGLVEELNNG
jgi:hypothetical protein